VNRYHQFRFLFFFSNAAWCADFQPLKGTTKIKLDHNKSMMVVSKTKSSSSAYLLIFVAVIAASLCLTQAMPDIRSTPSKKSTNSVTAAAAAAHRSGIDSCQRGRLCGIARYGTRNTSRFRSILNYTRVCHCDQGLSCVLTADNLQNRGYAFHCRKSETIGNMFLFPSTISR